MKLIDFDGLFDKKLTDYMEENAGKFSERQWESMIAKLYTKFGDTYLKVAGDTPKGYYKKMSNAELIATLVAHVERDVPVSDFLCRELEERGCPDEILPLLESENEQLLGFAVNLAGSNEKAFDAYFHILLGEKADGEIKEIVTEQLKGNADRAKEQALSYYKEGKEVELMLEILSRVKEKDERVFEILTKELRTAEEEMPMRASYLAAYGDERALPLLLDMIAREEINFLQFTELKYAIEALGGSYNEERDFTADPYFQEVMSQSQLAPDLFAENKKSDA